MQIEESFVAELRVGASLADEENFGHLVEIYVQIIHFLVLFHVASQKVDLQAQVHLLERIFVLWPMIFRVDSLFALPDFLDFGYTILDSLGQVDDRPREMVRHKVDYDVANDDVAEWSENKVGEPKVEHRFEQVVFYLQNSAPHVPVTQKYYIVLFIVRDEVAIEGQIECVVHEKDYCVADGVLWGCLFRLQEPVFGKVTSFIFSNFCRLFPILLFSLFYFIFRCFSLFSVSILVFDHIFYICNLLRFEVKIAWVHIINGVENARFVVE